MTAFASNAGARGERLYNSRSPGCVLLPYIQFRCDERKRHIRERYVFRIKRLSVASPVYDLEQENARHLQAFKKIPAWEASLLTSVMKILASQISKELERANHCAVYEPEITRVWPDNGNKRETEIALFAEKHGWRLRYYKDGFCAIFDKVPSG